MKPTRNRRLKPRDGPAVLMAGNLSPDHLKWLSLARDRRTQGLDYNHAKYFYGASAGQGSFIYVFDAKVDWDHVVS